MNSEFKELFQADLGRYGLNLKGERRRFHYFLRKIQTERNPLLKLYYRYRFSKLKSKMHIELAASSYIGKGLYLGHPYCITINPDAKIGDNCNIHKGVTIGQENRGLRKGVPVIGNCVWIGINSTIVGKIKIGDDVLIAPNTYVNCDIPAHSVVFGNPCVIKHRDNATEDYINRIAE